MNLRQILGLEKAPTATLPLPITPAATTEPPADVQAQLTALAAQVTAQSEQIQALTTVNKELQAKLEGNDKASAFAAEVKAKAEEIGFHGDTAEAVATGDMVAALTVMYRTLHACASAGAQATVTALPKAVGETQKDDPKKEGLAAIVITSTNASSDEVLTARQQALAEAAAAGKTGADAVAFAMSKYPNLFTA